MKKAYSLMLLTLLMALKPVMAQQFNYTYNGVTVTYYITSIPKHEVKVYYVPKNVTAVTIPAAVTFNGESFRVTKIGDGSCKGGAIIIFGIMDPDLCNDYYSFRDCKLLKSVVLPNTIKEIGESAFRGCVWLKSIKLPTGLEKIGPAAFSDCGNLNLSSLTLPSGLRQLGDTVISYGIKGNVFNNCNGTLYIPETVSIIGKEALIGCSYQLSEKIGFIWNDTIIINNEDGKRRIGAAAFGEKAISISRFRKKIVSSPDYYLNLSYGKSVASLVKRTLIDGGKYKEVISYYPNDTEVLELQKKAEEEARIEESKKYARQGDVFFNAGIYENAKEQYEMAANLNPNDMSLRTKLNNADEAIAEQERLRKEAEERARRAEEESQIRTFVGLRSSAAKEAISHGHLQLAVNELQQALDTAEAHNYDYRKAELTQRIDSIRRVQDQISDKSKVFDYKSFRPDLYETTNHALNLRIKTFMEERDKRIAQNHISFVLNTGTQPGFFQLTESSKPLKKFCKEVLETERLKPLVIDGQMLNGQATFNYDIEYACGTVKVQLRENQMSAKPKYEISPQLESNLKKTIQDKIGNLPSSCNGNYKFDVTSLDINGQMVHNFELKKVHCFNGPQNAWRSVLLPGWGDKYVEQDGKFDSWKTVVSYGFISLGIYLMTNTIKYKTTQSGWVWDSTWVDVSDDPFYVSHGTTGWWAYSNYHYETREIEHAKKYTGLGIACTIIGGTIWISDVIYVWVKGANNKRDIKNRLGQLSFAYNPTYNTTEFVYSLRF